MKAHSERAHSKFSASGAERWFACPGSVALSEGLPDKPSPWALEGTEAHEVLETVVNRMMADEKRFDFPGKPADMAAHAFRAAAFLLNQHAKIPGSDFLVESRVYLDFIHPEAFGTLDYAIVDHFGTLHVFDYKYGAGKAVSPIENLQMLFYGIALAAPYRWNFKTVRLWVIQPRVKGYEGPVFWDVPMYELRARWVPAFQTAIRRAVDEPTAYVEGGHCHWCRAKSVCPLKRESKLSEAARIFSLPSFP